MNRNSLNSRSASRWSAPTAFTKSRDPSDTLAKNGVDPRASTFAGRTDVTSNPARSRASWTSGSVTRPLGDPATRWTAAPIVQPNTNPPTTSSGRWAPTNTLATPTVMGKIQTHRRHRRTTKGTAVAASAAETAAWPDGKPRPLAADPWITTLWRSAPG